MALGTNLPPSHSIELLKTLGKGMGEVQNCVKFRLKFIASSRHAAHETGIKLEKQFYVLVVINSVRLALFPGFPCAVASDGKLGVAWERG